MRNTITLAANEAATITEKEAGHSGSYNEVTLGQDGRIAPLAPSATSWSSTGVEPWFR